MPKRSAKRNVHSVKRPASLFTGLTILVNDVGRSVEYYSKIPGVSIAVSTPEFAMLKLGKKSRLGFLKSKTKGFHMEFESYDLDGLHSKLEKLSHGKISVPASRPWGERSFMVTDPDGYEIEFEDGGSSRSA